MTHEDKVNEIAFSPDGQYVATASSDSTARIWATPEAGVIPGLTKAEKVKVIAYSPDGRFAAVNFDQNVLQVLATSNGNVAADLRPLRKADLAGFNADGRYLATESTDIIDTKGTARVWDLMAEQEVARYGHQAQITSQAFSPDGRYVAGTANEGTARVWKITDGTEVVRIHDPFIRFSAFSTDGRFLITGGANGSIQKHLLSPADLIEKACSFLQTNLSQEKWDQYLPGEPFRKICPGLPVPAAISEGSVPELEELEDQNPK